MTLRRALAVSAAAWLLAGCGGGTGGGVGTPASSSPTWDERQQLLKIADCARRNGLPNFPDPAQDKDGDWEFPDSVKDTKPPKACEELVRTYKQRNPKGGGPGPASAADMVKLRRFALCMRQQGLPDWPDPNDEGVFQVPPRLRPPRSPENDPVWKKADKACRQPAPFNVRIGVPETDGGDK